MVTSVGFLKAQLDHYSNHDSEICLMFQNGISLVSVQKYYLISAVLVKATLVHCPLKQLIVNKDGFHGVSCRLAPCKSQTI